MDPANPGEPLKVGGFPEDILLEYPRSGTAVMAGLTPANNYSSVSSTSMGHGS
jgi:hypothetical protein